MTTKDELLLFDLAAMLEGPIVRHSLSSSPSSSSIPSVAVSDKLVALLDGESSAVQVHRVKDKYLFSFFIYI